MNRKFLAARSDLVDRLKEIAKNKNLTRCALASEALQQFLKAKEKGKPLAQIIDEYGFLKLAKDTGFTLAPESLYYTLGEKNFKEDAASLRESWRDIGEWFGKFCRTIFSKETNLLEKMLAAILWNFSESMSFEGGEANVRCVGSKCHASCTALLALFLAGFMQAYGYSVFREQVSRGIIVATYCKRQ